MVIVWNQSHAPLRLKGGIIVRHGRRIDLHNREEHQMSDFALPEPPVGCAPNFTLLPDADALMMEIRSTMQAGFEATRRARSAADAALKNELDTPAKRHLNARDLSGKIIKGVTERYNRTGVTLNAELERLERLTRMPPRASDAREQLRINEICAALRVMTPKERAAALLDAINSGNGDEGVVAVLSMPGFVTGMREVEAESMRLHWRGAKYPQEVKRIAELHRLKAHFHRSGELLVAYPAKLYDRRAVESGEKSQQAAREALAAAGAA